jgi:hypothetical protein
MLGFSKIQYISKNTVYCASREAKRIISFFFSFKDQSGTIELEEFFQMMANRLLGLLKG